MDGLTIFTERFPLHEFTLRRLHGSDPEFRALCADYVTARSALGRWKAYEARAAEYRKIIRELEDEALEYIEGRHPKQVEGG
jgi:hypothetical protein